MQHFPTILSLPLTWHVCPDISGVLEGEQLIRGSSTRSNLGYREQAVVYHDPESHPRSNHSYLRPIITTPSATPSSDGDFNDWAVLSRPASHSINMHIYGLLGSPGSTSGLVCSRASSFFDNAYKHLRRTYPHRLQRLRDLDTESYTRLSIHSRMIYFWEY